MYRVPLVFVCACVFAVQPLRAQTTSDSITTSFHPGQWGVGFTQGRYLAEAGVLRFSTPTLAWVLDATGTFDRQVLSGAGVFGADESAKSYTVTALAGPRWYHAIGAHVVRLIGIGLLGSYSSYENVGSPNRSKFWSAGAYGEIGVQYMFTRHVGLGWRANLLVSRGHERSNYLTGNGSVVDETYYHVDLQPVQVTGTVYF
jgi:hypothetical protein